MKEIMKEFDERFPSHPHALSGSFDSGLDATAEEVKQFISEKLQEQREYYENHEKMDEKDFQKKA